MSELLTINTETGVVPEEEILPLPLYGEHHDALSRVIPEYAEPLPNPGMTKLIKRMKMTMKLYNGLGLSANQCDVDARVFVIGTDQFQIACINPKITEVSVETHKIKEGCLSYPGLFLMIDRHQTIEVEYTDENGNRVKQLMEGITAQCFQHELDHLNGIKMEQHVGPLALSMAKKRRDKVLKKVMRKR
jgi:peptide deformylase